ncbi:MAG: NUDIX domain-containing protein [Candidatus Woesearchaeota archaeon]
MKANASQIKVAVDAVVFSVVNESLKVLLIRRKKAPFKGMYALPGGFVEPHENLEEAVKRELAEETNVKNVFLQQLGAYGELERDPRGRIVSIAFLAFISPEQKLGSTKDAAGAEWHSADDLDDLAFDHRKIIEDSLRQIRYEIQTTNIAFQILPTEFTLSELQHLYELVLKMPLDKRNFRRRIKELDILKKISGAKMEGAHRPAQLYSFREREYKPLKDRIHIFT